MRSIELTLDSPTETAIVKDWDQLETAGLPSLARNTSSSNRPHITVAAGPAIEATDATAAACGALPLEMSFGGLVLFGTASGKFVLSRSVVLSEQLADFHRAVHETITGTLDQTLPGRWTPHVTLARHLTRAEVGAALAVLGPVPDGKCVGLRLWDGESRSIRLLSARTE
ncbi:MAG: 2-5 ligase family protein [Microbacteriaceae bacterium]|nr:2-5 ligase family protein [Microbacteriaceae bacterium]